MDAREAANRAAADYLAELRKRVADGKSEIERQKASVDETHEHLAGMNRWIEQTDRQLGQERERRARHGETSADS
jgi:Sec-independent protein translocase protein TatA